MKIIHGDFDEPPERYLLDRERVLNLFHALAKHLVRTRASRLKPPRQAILGNYLLGLGYGVGAAAVLLLFLAPRIGGPNPRIVTLIGVALILFAVGLLFLQALGGRASM